MVTYISSANADKYNLLFDKASKALIANPPAENSENFTDDFAITTLNEYFAYLEDLVKVSDDEDISRFFVRLPLDEDFFEIDANSRTIKVPSGSFGRYGVGVQGDELAEVVYFTIDRFFDSTDLANNDINIVIQWEAKNENRETIAGISQHFGKDIETIPGKIIFGWPISHELTAAAGNIKFAVRFYQLGEDSSEDTHQLVYSFSTLPAEVSINASLNYDVINKTVKEIDHGKVITSRIRRNGVYDAGAPIPGTPVVTVPLYVVSPEGNELVKIVDLPVGEDSVVKLAICARNADIGAISYDWKKFAYDPTSGGYESTSSSLTSKIEYQEVPTTEELSENQEYYTVQFDDEDRVVTATLVSRDRIANIEVDSNAFLENGTEIHLYKKMSVASVNTVGEYSVDVIASTSVNTTPRKMPSDERIRIPGPMKPVINLPEESADISVTEEDRTVHAIANNGTIVLTAPAVPGESDRPASEVGEDPQVILTYNWKKLDSDGTASNVITTAVESDFTVAVLPSAQLPEDPEWLENAEEDGVLGAKGQFNQEHITLLQNGNIVTIYANDTLKFFNSTNPAQGEHQWIALDIDTKQDHLAGCTWGSDNNPENAYTFVDEDENDLGVANGHILFWFKADEAPVSRYVNGIELRFRVLTEAPVNTTYSVNGNEITIIGLPEEGLDNSYVCEVTATRNKKSTTETSGEYRVTNSPEAPVLSYNGAPVDLVIHQIPKKRKGIYQTLSFATAEPALSDGITYLWMHAVIDDDEDYDDLNEIKAQIDLDGALAAILGNTAFPGTKDIICDSDVARYENGDIVFGTDYGSSSYQLKEEDGGIYYCIVINELNNNKAASVGPFFNVTT